MEKKVLFYDNESPRKFPLRRCLFGFKFYSSWFEFVLDYIWYNINILWYNIDRIGHNIDRIGHNMAETLNMVKGNFPKNENAIFTANKNFPGKITSATF